MRQYFGVPTLEARRIFDPTKPFAFLGGTINGSTWRAKMVQHLEVEYFDPVVLEWTPDDRDREEQAKKLATVLLYTITPKQLGFYGIAEATHAVYSVARNLDKRVVILILDEDDGITYEEHQVDSIRAIKELLSWNPAVHVFSTIEETASWINAELKSEASRGD